MSDLSDPIYNNEKAARAYLEATRWGDTPFCPRCGATEGIKRLGGKSEERGLLHCKECRKAFTVTVGTLYERSHIALHKWVLATHLLCASKKGISAHQLHRMLGVTYKTAWFMAHRIREGMREQSPGPMGGGGQTVEVDETYWGGKKTASVFRNERGWVRPSGGTRHKEKIVTLVERGGRARSFHVPSVNSRTLRQVIRSQMRADSRLMTDDAHYYVNVGKEYDAHDSVNHSMKEYVRGDAHTNTIENYFSILKRGLTGVYQHVSSKHMKRYLGEFDFRYSSRKITDKERLALALEGIEGRRLTYKRTGRGLGA